MQCWTQSEKNIFVAAHRGWCGKYPENTMAAFRAALELGVDQIETDVRITKDGELVLIHDGTVDRTTNGTGAVDAYTFEELRKLDAGNGEQIPTLIELMELVKDHPTLTLDIELKEYPTEGREALSYSVCDRVLEIIDRYGFTDRCVVNTFSGKLHEYIAEKYKAKYKQHVYYPARHLGACEKDPYAYAYCTCIFGLEDEVTAEDAKALHEKYGVRIWAGAYVKDEQGVDLAVKIGSELITCNNPDEILGILRKRGLHK